MIKGALLVLSGLLLGGCAKETILVPLGAPIPATPRSEPAPHPAGAHVEGRPGPNAAASLLSATRTTSRPGGGGALGRSITGGEHCLGWLRQHGIVHRALGPRPGMDTPVEVRGPIGGIWFRTEAKPNIVCDCRLAVALHWVAPELRAMGVTEVRHSGAYVFRTQKNGKPSLHARGLAIDVHDVAIGDQRLSVEASYQRGIHDGCRGGASPLNQITCRLGRTGLFKELITPDDDRDHHDHLHLAIAPL